MSVKISNRGEIMEVRKYRSPEDGRLKDRSPEVQKSGSPEVQKSGSPEDGSPEDGSPEVQSLQ